MAQKPALSKGTRDFGPLEMRRRSFIFDTIREVFRKYGYQAIETPAIERLDVLLGKYGDEGDRLIFKILNSGDFFSKRGKQVVFPEDMEKGENHFASLISEKGLRYDLTVPFARFVVMHQNDITFPFRRYQIQPVYRADRPQAGRYQEFYQCDADVVGSDSLLFEAEFIAMYDEALSTLGLEDFTIRVSNRKVLNGIAEAVGQPDRFMDIVVSIDKLDKIGKDGVAKELAERGLLEAAASEVLQLIAFEGTTEEKLAFLEKAFANSETGKKGIAELREVFGLYQFMPRFKGKVEFDLTLARGLGYYTGFITEVVSNEVSIGSIGGGGRYDDLTGVFGREGLSGVGISFGAARIYDVLEKLDRFQHISPAASKVLLINFGEGSRKATMEMLSQLRKAGIAAELYPEDAKMKKQFSYADKNAIPYTLMIGETEAESGLYQLKNMSSGEQESMRPEAIVKALEA
ncbi:MAG: histidine--tRNA ligase [Bacteroidia bacterium]